MDLCYIDENEIWHCLFVKQKGSNKGILVQPDGCNFTKYAAYYNEDTEDNEFKRNLVV
jgi:hypothetical protein